MTKFNESKMTRKAAGQALKGKKDNYLLVWDKAVKCFDDGHYKKAISLFSELLRALPGYAEAYQKRGEAYQYFENHRKAVADFNKAIRLSRKNPDPFIFIFRAGSYFAMGDFTRAIKEYNQYCKSDPDSAPAYTGRGEAFFKMDKLANAMKDFSKAIKLDPDNYYDTNNQAYLFSAMIMFKKGNQKRAKEFFNRAIEGKFPVRYLFLAYKDELWQLARDGFLPALEYLYKTAKTTPVKRGRHKNV